MNLNRLSNRETLAMAAYILGTEVMGSDLEELILSKTEGIPFFVEEFMKSLKDLGMIEWRDSGYYLAKDIQEVAIPSTIQDVIMARVDSLPEGAKSVLQTGSAIGREFSCELIKRVTGIPTPEMTPHLSVLRDSELLYERGIFPQATYIFRHSLTQEVAYDSLLLKRRQEIHEVIGQAIEELYPDRLEEFYEVLAHHYSRSENHEKAYQYLKLSGEKAILNHSLWETFRFFKEAINALNRLPDTEENKRKGIEVRLLIAAPLMGLAYPENSLQILEEGERLSKDLGDEGSLARLCGLIGLCYSLQGDSLQALDYTERAFRAAEGIQDIETMASTAVSLCPSYLVTGDSLKIVQVASRVIDLLESTNREAECFGSIMNPYAALLAQYGSAAGSLGNFEEGEALLEKALRHASELNNLYNIGYAELWYSALFANKGDGESTIKHAQNCVRYCEEAQFPVLLGTASLLLGGGYHLLGDLDKDREYLEKSLQINRDLGLAVGLPFVYCALGWLEIDAGDLESAQSNAEEALKLSRSSNQKATEARSQILLGTVLGKLDISQKGKAEEYILQGIRIYDELKLKPSSSYGYSRLGELYADTGPKEKALEHLKKAEAEFREMGMDYFLRRTREVLERVEG